MEEFLGPGWLRFHPDRVTVGPEVSEAQDLGLLRDGARTETRLRRAEPPGSVPADVERGVEHGALGAVPPGNRR
ncbi:hypothetical protein CSUB01_12458 [Colletotrichum sublineola]|uniref:Uncharacterized protein n=1 Tax=Colletotrichum sublineola TaxID=1173701 RepID=A0A066XL78_COLSU|nr:hypothetical protein CSUB01_12458 [Colletotrichum sublineola]